MPRAHPPLLTADDLAELGSRAKRHELWDGALLVREPAGGPSDFISLRLGHRLEAYVEPRELGGVAASNTGFLVAREPDRVLSPDTGFVLRTRLPQLPARGFIPMAPDIAIEVCSPSDAWVGTIEKCGVWIAHGVSLVVAVDPATRDVVAFRPREAPEELTANDTLRCDPVLPRLRIRLAGLWRGLPTQSIVSTRGA